MKEAHLHDREDGRTLRIHFSHEQFLVRQTASLTSFSYAPPSLFLWIIDDKFFPGAMLFIGLIPIHIVRARTAMWA
jgi:hypothetical protein